MLAKKLKIENLRKQRDFIEENLLAPRKDGDPTYSYIGYVFPEVIEYFEK